MTIDLTLLATTVMREEAVLDISSTCIAVVHGTTVSHVNDHNELHADSLVEKIFVVA